MEGYCTCGAKLPDDALFCHRCGRPLRELVEPERDEAPEFAPPPPPVIEAPPSDANPVSVTFRNGIAVRVSLMAAAIVQLVTTLSAAAGAALLMPLLALGGGFYSVMLFARRTGTRLSPLNGARMGWMTGIFFFAISLFFMAGTALLSGGDQLRKAFQDGAKISGVPPEVAQQLEKVTSDPASFAFLIVSSLVFQFILVTLLFSAGGALGAKLRGEKH